MGRRRPLGVRRLSESRGRRFGTWRIVVAVKLASLETLACDAGWRPWLFVKATTDDGLVGWSEVTDSHGSPTGLAGVVGDLAPLVVGRDPLAVEAIHWDLYRRTRQSPGSIVQKAIGGIENALLDLKGKALGVSVAELFGGPTRETDPALLVALRDDARAGLGGDRHARSSTPTTRSPPSAARSSSSGYRAFKTNIVVPGDEPRVLMPGFGRDGGTDRNPTPELLDALTRLLEAFREGTGGKAQPIVDLNFNLTTEGIVRVARALEPFDLAWLEVDSYDAAALAHARRRSPVPLCSGENLYTLRGFRPVPRGRRDGRRLRRRDLERLRAVAEDRRARRDARGRLRAAQLLQPPRDLHRGAVVRRDPERAAARDRRGRRPLARGADDRGAGDPRRRARRARSARAGAATSARTCSPLTPCRSCRGAVRATAGRPVVPQPELEAGELPELVDDRVRDPAPAARAPEPGELLARVARARAAERGARLVALDVGVLARTRRSRRTAGTPSAIVYACEWRTAARGS